MKSVTASAPANIFITGEQAVVYGYPSLLAGVQKRIFVSSEILKKPVICVVSDSLGKKEFTFKEALKEKPPATEPLYPLAKLCATLSKRSPNDTGLRVNVLSEVPTEAGMSSSGATLCALACSVSKLLSIQEINWYDILYPLQKWIHGGKASGAELTSSQHGNIHVFRKQENSVKVRPHFKKISSPPLTVVIGDTCIRAPTALTAGVHIPSLMKRKPSFVKDSFEQIGKLTCKAVEKIKKGNLIGLGSVINKNQKILRSLLVSHPKLDDAIEEALCAGALGAKLTGGGWGGVMFALVTLDSATKVEEAIRETGCKTYLTKIGGPGMRIESCND